MKGFRAFFLKKFGSWRAKTFNLGFSKLKFRFKQQILFKSSILMKYRSSKVLQTYWKTPLFKSPHNWVGLFQKKTIFSAVTPTHQTEKNYFSFGVVSVLMEKTQNSAPGSEREIRNGGVWDQVVVCGQRRKNCFKTKLNLNWKIIFQLLLHL